MGKTKRPDPEQSEPALSSPEPRPKRWPLTRAFALTILLAGLFAASAFYFWMHSFLSTPPARALQEKAADQALSDGPVVFTIQPGQGLSLIALNLARKGLITDPFRFKLYARYKKAGTRLKAGEYQLSRTATPDMILDDLVTGKVKLYRFTIPEGLNMTEISQVVEKAGICSREHFLALCRDTEFIRELGLGATSLEGYLFPDTYLYPKSASCRQIIHRMVRGFDRVFTHAWRERAKVLGYSVHEIVTLASVIEKETGDPDERPIISSVFHNRLNRGMKLESDPTVIYGQTDYHGRIRYKHLRRVTPYNTYQIKGLPAGPIASPGKQALHAALYPAETDFLFFVSKNDTTHQFSKTLKAHNRAVRKYQLGQ